MHARTEPAVGDEVRDAIDVWALRGEIGESAGRRNGSSDERHRDEPRAPSHPRSLTCVCVASCPSRDPIATV